MDELRQAIRELLAEELERLGAAPRGGAAADTTPRPQVREERVSITSDAELAAFVRRLGELYRDGNARRDIEAGRWRFRLAAGGRPAAAASAGTAAAGGTARFERGLVSEREVHTLPADTRVVEAGRRVRFTPLAADAMRRRGITLKRTES